jgi:uncharacterized protein (DUF779 family)
MTSVTFSPAALTLLRRLQAEHGPVLLHLSGGGCEGSTPICLRQSEFHTGTDDVLLATVEGCPVYVGPHQARYWVNSATTIDITEGGGDSFSLEAPNGVRFLACTRLLPA